MNLHQGWLIIIREQQLLTRVDQPWQLLQTADVESHWLTEQVLHPVGQYQDKHCCVIEADRDFDGYEWVGLRSQLVGLSPEQYNLLSRAVQLLTWDNQHRYCGQCGRPTQKHPQEFARFCDPCHLFFYPRIAPCIMCLITRGDYCLLAQHQKHPDGFYATLAGFVEAGETLEQALHREVMEEVRLIVNNLKYYASQSWPFPHQLMVAYFAEYQTGDIKVDDEEIVDAQWFHYKSLPDFPPKESISGQLIHEFIKQREMVESSAS